MKIKTALIQMAVSPGDKSKNLETLIRLTENIENDCDFLILPELWNTGYSDVEPVLFAETSKDISVKTLRGIAKKHSVNIIGGSFIEKHNDGFFNTMPVIGRKGDLIHKYRKVHLFSPGIHEDEYFSAGDNWGICDCDGMTVGLMLCYDLRFPAFCRNLALHGAKMIFISAQWPAGRIEHFEVLLRARAIENGVFLIAVNNCGLDYPGNSLVISPYGDVLAKCGNTEEVIYCEFDTAECDSYRNLLPVYNDRKNILDEIDNNLF